jgi:hypothetical protein
MGKVHEGNENRCHASPPEPQTAVLQIRLYTISENIYALNSTQNMFTRLIRFHYGNCGYRVRHVFAHAEFLVTHAYLHNFLLNKFL